MKTAFCFDELAITVEDIHFVDPDPEPGQEGPERGARIEIRLRQERPHRGSIYASQPLVLDRALWRVDLLETVEAPGSCDRMHLHPVMVDDEPGHRVFDTELSRDPIGWLRRHLSHLPDVLTRAGVPDVTAYAADIDAATSALPEVMSCVDNALSRARAGLTPTADT